MRAREYKPIPITPRDGGILATDISLETVGLTNYRLKRNWRRYLNREIRREGFDFFRPKLTIPIGNQPLRADGPVTLIFKAVRSNGQRAVIAGTQTTLYRYVATESLDYCPGYAPGYFSDIDTNWIEIGTGFSTAGHRWEAYQIGDEMIFNNGVDLPVSYSLNALQVTPLYELRESGVSTVNTGTAYNGVNLFGDIVQIKDGPNPLTGNTFFQDLAYPIHPNAFAGQQGAQSSKVPGVQIGLATQAVGSFQVEIVQTGPFTFSAGMVGKTVLFANGFRGSITAYVSPTQILINQTPLAEPVLGPELVGVLQTMDSYIQQNFPSLPVGYPNAFWLPLGTYYFDGPAGSEIAIANSTSFYGPRSTFSGGGIVYFYGHSYSLKQVFGSGGGNNSLPFFILRSDNSDFIVNSNTSVFDASMVGRRLFFYSGEVRTILEFIDAGHVVVDSFLPVFLTGGSSQGQAVARTLFTIENTTYSTITDTSKVDRINYRVLWSSLNGPTRFAATVQCSINAGSKLLLLDYPAKSFSAGQSVIVLGAGISGGNLTATVLQANGIYLLLDTPADTTVPISNFGEGQGLVQASDATGSIVGFEDLEQDGTAVIRMSELNETLVVYRGKGYQLGAYTGSITSPFQFNEMVKTAERSLFYPYSLIQVTGNNQNGQGIAFHLFAGMNGFYRYDMVTKMPTEFEPFQQCQRTFLNQAALISTAYGMPFSDSVFSCENELTKEIFFCFPSSTVDTSLCFDYVQNTVSIMDFPLTAGGMVFSPSTGENLFVAGNPDGFVITYGLATMSHPEWTNVVVSSAGDVEFNGQYAINSQARYVKTSDPQFVFFQTAIGWNLSQDDVSHYTYRSSTPNLTGAWQVSFTFPEDAPAPTVGYSSSSTTLYTRLGEQYLSDCWSGLGSFGTSFNQKTVNSHMIEVSSFTDNTNITTKLYGAESPNSANVGQEKLLAAKTFGTPSVTNVLPAYFAATYFADRIQATGTGPCEFVVRTFSVDLMSTRGATHTPY